jgi:hypothetical protein
MNRKGFRDAMGFLLAPALVALLPASSQAQCTSIGATTCTAGTEVEWVCTPAGAQHVPVPASCAFMQAKLWGGGGHSGCGNGYCTGNGYGGGNGGGGGAVIVTAQVSPQQSLLINVPPHDQGWGYGGRPTTLERESSPYLFLAGAGGGGGGGMRVQWLPPFGPCYPPGGEIGHGGAGGGSVGEAGTNATVRRRAGGCSDPAESMVTVGGGLGGSVLAGGAGGFGYPSSNWDGDPGLYGNVVGGTGAQTAGSGGRGFYGGGGGGSVMDTADGFHAASGAGGGGAASVVGTDASILGGATYPGSRTTPGNASDPDRGAADGDGRRAGDGGLFATLPGDSTGLGKAGRVVIRMRAACGSGPNCGPYASPTSLPFAELIHGSRITDRFTAGAAPQIAYQIHQEPYASYEVVVDATSGDIGNPSSTPLRLERVDLLANVLQSGTAAGAGYTRSLRWRNTSSSPISDHLVRVASATCSTGCGPDDLYRIRAYDTTYAIARFNNVIGAQTQTTHVILQNPTGTSVNVVLHFWGETGTLLHSQPLTLVPRSVKVFDTTTVVSGLKGSITVSNDAPYGRLSGKATTVEVPSGFAFDTPLVARQR